MEKDSQAAQAESFQPYVPASDSPLEFTVKSVLLGILFGIIFGAANAYLGLRTGLTISTSIPVAVMSVAVFRILRKSGIQSSILETNIAQTTGSASSSLASGIIFTLPALFMWQVAPDLLQMTVLAMSGGLIGVLFMIPLRRFLIEKEHGKLPYPEGTACAEVLKASETGGAKAKNIFIGLGIGAGFKFLTSWMHLIPGGVTAKIPFLPKAQVGMDLSPALFGVGYILGLRVALIMVGGGLLSWLVIIPVIATWGSGLSEPLYPETAMLINDMSAGQIWTRYVRYIGAGAVASAGIITLIRTIPVMIKSFKVGASQLDSRMSGQSESDVPRTSRDLPLKNVFVALAGIGLFLAITPIAFGDLGGVGARLVAAFCVVLFAFFFVTVASRIVGMVGVTSNPTSGMTIAALLGTSIIFLAMGWTDTVGKAMALTVGCVVAIAASISGDTSQDLKTGFLLGATPKRQQQGELIGVLTSAVFVCGAVLLLGEVFTFGSAELPAPQATLMKLVIDGVIDQNLPWTLVGIGVGITLLCELARIPSLPFAVGVYLPVSTMTPIFLGGLLRYYVEKRTKKKAEKDQKAENGVLLGSGFVGGEGLMGVGIAVSAFINSKKPEGIGTEWLGSDFIAMLAGGFVFAAMVSWFWRRVNRLD